MSIISNTKKNKLEFILKSLKKEGKFIFKVSVWNNCKNDFINKEYFNNIENAKNYIINYK
jgi:hypothetical protein